MKTGEDFAIFPCPDVSPGGFEPPTFRLGGEPSIQLRYEDILDFPLFSRLCRDGQENHESNDSAHRASALWIPLSRFERRTKNSKFDLAHDNIFLRRTIELFFPCSPMYVKAFVYQGFFAFRVHSGSSMFPLVVRYPQRLIRRFLDFSNKEKKNSFQLSPILAENPPFNKSPKSVRWGKG